MHQHHTQCNAITNLTIIIAGNLKGIMSLNSQATSKLIMQCFTQQHQTVIDSLSPFPELQYQYLKALLGESKSKDILEKSGFKVTSELNELFVALMCSFEPQAVYKFLCYHENYR